MIGGDRSNNYRTKEFQKLFAITNNNKGVVREIWISVITLNLIRNISESYDAMASKVDVLHRKMYNRQPQVIGKTFENLEIPGKPKELLVYGSKV